MSERMRDLHPGHDRMTVDISVRVFAAEIPQGFKPCDTRKSSTSPGSVKKQIKTTQNLVKARNQRPLRDSKNANLTLLRHSTFELMSNFGMEFLTLIEVFRRAFETDNPTPFLPNSRPHNDFSRAMLLMLFCRRLKKRMNKVGVYIKFRSFGRTDTRCGGQFAISRPKCVRMLSLKAGF